MTRLALILHVGLSNNHIVALADIDIVSLLILFILFMAYIGIVLLFILFILFTAYIDCSVDAHNTLAHLEVYVAIITSYRIVFAVPVELQRWTSIKPTLFQLVEVFSRLRRQSQAKIIKKLVGFGFLI